MTTNRKKTSSGTGKTIAEAGMIVAGAVATAAGAYFLYGKQSTKTKKKIRGWVLKAKGEILEELEHMQHVGQEQYQETVDRVAKKYAALKHVDRKELEGIVRELKGHWKSIKTQLMKSVPKGVRASSRKTSRRSIK